ncbi:MAG: nucleotidyltransferase domain-containing protein [Alkalimonas sp.]|nr:nucleotidyltransferase domain-containing protein [Alkalimonas sp.]
MNKPERLQVSEQEWQQVDAILQQYLPQVPVWAFGSRVHGKAKPYSDLDLAIISEQPLSLSQLAEIAEAFSESDLPWKVDLVDWASTSADFRRIIAAQKLVLPSKETSKDSHA